MSTRPATAGGTHRLSRAAGLWLLVVAVGIAWFALLAPPSVGGQTGLVLVDGHSMEPMLHTGDVVLVRRATGYAVGDLVVSATPDGGVIHRLVSGSAATGWRTQGDNNSWVDRWTVRDDQIAGRYWTSVPSAGLLLGWVSHHPVQFGMVMAVLVTLGYLPWHRRRVTPELADALGHATHEPARSGRPATELELLTFSAVAALSCAAVAGVLWMSRAPFGPTWLALLGGAAVSGAIAWSMASRLFDGRGLAEPLASDYALSGRLYLVTEFPAGAEDAVVAESAVDLRHLAESHRLPILHRVDPDTGVQDFLLITVRHGSFSWRASPTGPTPIVAPTR